MVMKLLINHGMSNTMITHVVQIAALIDVLVIYFTSEAAYSISHTLGAR